MAAEKRKFKYDDSSSSSSSMAGSREKRLETASSSSWSNLIIDIMKIILGKLSFSDVIRARAICKNWLLPLNEIPRSSLSKIPWIMSFERNEDNVSSRCQLHDPFYYNQPYIVEKEICISNETGAKFVGAEICASKHGWAMFYHSTTNNSNHITNFFLFNPFTNHTITLPNLITRRSRHSSRSFDIATFSSSPDKDDCIFFVLGKGLFSQRNFIRTYRLGEQGWMFFEFDGKDDDGWGLNNFFRGSVYIDGTFYCVSHHGTLGSFTVARNEWNYLTNLCPKLNDKFFFTYIVELNGELLLVYMSYKFKRLYIFDMVDNVWVSRERRYLKHTALFLGSYGSFAVSVDADGDPYRISNKIYNDDDECIFCHPLYKDQWEEPEEIYDGKIRWYGIWIQPPSSF